MKHGSHRPPDENERLRAVVLLSGGLDSATCLAMARADGYECHALSVAYGQRHEAEIAAYARRVVHFADGAVVSDVRQQGAPGRVG